MVGSAQTLGVMNSDRVLLGSRFLRNSVATLLALAATACAVEPKVVTSGACTVIQRPGYAEALSFQTQYLKSINVLFEFPAQHFQDVTLNASRQMLDDQVVAVYIEPSSQAAAKPGGCIATSHDRQACTFASPILESSGFLLVVVAIRSAGSQRILAATSEYWNAVSACPR